jgi:hypothetical protein
MKTKTNGKRQKPLASVSGSVALCATCKHYCGLKADEYGKCRRYPPTLSPLYGNSEYPNVGVNMTCGEYAPHITGDWNCNNLREQIEQEEGKQTTMQAERDQLIKVVDELTKSLDVRKPWLNLSDAQKAALAAYSLLPHVQAKKGNKQ